MQEKMKIGIIGCGNISGAYFGGAQKTEALEIKSCADIRMEAAQNAAERYGCQAVTVDELLADPEIKLVVNLTVPRAHVEVGLQVLEAGKHVYSEKPLGVSFEEGQKLIQLASEKGLRVGCAPDTVLGAGGQTARQAMDEGNWDTAQYYLNLAAEGAVDLDLEVGKIDPTEAVNRFMELGYGPNESKARVAELQSSLFALTSKSYNIDVYIRTHGSVSVPDMPNASSEKKIGPYASGTGGWMQVPGASGQPVTATLHGGEMFNVVNPARGQSAGGNTVNWYGDAIFQTAGEAMAFLARMQSNAARNAASASAGGGYIG